MMRLTRQAEIAVQVLALCERSGAGPGSGRAITTRQAAGFAGTTKDHAAQVVARLVRDGWLESVRGRGGGIRLTRPASEIRLGAIIRLMEPSFNDGVQGEQRHSGWPEEPWPETEHVGATGEFDALHRSALGSFLSVFDDFTVADLGNVSGGSRIGCLDCDLHAIVQQMRATARLRRRLGHRQLSPDAAAPWSTRISPDINP